MGILRFDLFGSRSFRFHTGLLSYPNIAMDDIALPTVTDFESRLSNHVGMLLLCITSVLPKPLKVEH